MWFGASGISGREHGALSLKVAIINSTKKRKIRSEIAWNCLEIAQNPPKVTIERSEVLEHCVRAERSSEPSVAARGPNSLPFSAASVLPPSLMENTPLLLSDPAEGRKFFRDILAETSKNGVFEAPKARRRRKILGSKRHYGEYPPPLVFVGFETRGYSP